MKNATLHYIYDPLCGWCYAAAPLIAVARELPNLNIAMHAGGMWTGAQVKHVTPELRAFVVANDARIGAVSRQAFGQNYFDGLLADDSAVLDSEPPIKAILAVEQLGYSGLEALSRTQKAHFVHGLQVSQQTTLSAIADNMGINTAQFDAAYEGIDIKAHTDQTRELMAKYQAQGFPTMVLVNGQSTERINHSQFYGQAEAFRAALLGLVNEAND